MNFRSGVLAALVSMLTATSASAGTSVFVENRTAVPLSFQVTQRGAPLEADAWTALMPIIPPGARMEVLRFNRDSGIVSDQRYVFETAVRTMPAQELVTTLTQTLVGRDVNSAIEVTAAGGASVTKDSTELGTASWKSAGKTGVVRYNLTRAVQSDVEYVIAEATAGEMPADGKFRLLSYNVQFLPRSVLSHGQLQRAVVIPTALPDCDAIVFNEAFDDEARAVLQGGIGVRWPHHTAVVGMDEGIGQDGGVFIASRWPIVAQAACVFDQERSEGMDVGSQKGAVYACIERPDGRVHVIGTHLQADQDAASEAARAFQLKAIGALIAAQKIPANEPLLIAGDMNVEWTNRREREAMLASLDAAVPQGFDPDEHSSDPRTNQLNFDAEGALLDYVLIANAHRRPVSSECRVLQLKGRSEMAWSHNVDFVTQRDVSTRDLSDHYPVLATFAFGAR